MVDQELFPALQALLDSIKVAFSEVPRGSSANWIIPDDKRDPDPEIFARTLNPYSWDTVPIDVAEVMIDYIFMSPDDAFKYWYSAFVFSTLRVLEDSREYSSAAARLAGIYAKDQTSFRKRFASFSEEQLRGIDSFLNFSLKVVEAFEKEFFGDDAIWKMQMEEYSDLFEMKAIANSYSHSMRTLLNERNG